MLIVMVGNRYIRGHVLPMGNGYGYGFLSMVDNRDGNGSGSDRVEQLPAHQQRSCR
jgi:hypothetical protein